MTLLSFTITANLVGEQTIPIVLPSVTLVKTQVAGAMGYKSTTDVDDPSVYFGFETVLFRAPLIHSTSAAH
ncbi:hypothetical protein PM082_009510 [Marasmius tenuissimus]|nr:hypothetical protein PM082_009510 [Marasmius tenuissimus]